MRWVAVLLAVVAISSCTQRGSENPTESKRANAGSAEASDSKPEKVVRFRGKITSASAEAAINALREGATTLEITSSGGEPESSLRLAEVVQERNIRVVVNGVCFSACVSYVLVASPSRNVLPGSLLGFHNTMWSMTLVPMSRELHEGFRPSQYVARETALYQRSGVSPALLLYPHYMLQPRCSLIVNDGEQNEQMLVRAVGDIYFLPKARLNEFGMRFDGAIPETPAEVNAAFAASGFKPASALRVMIEPRDGAPLPPQEEIEKRFQTLPPCD